MARKIKKYPKKRWGERSKAEKWGVAKRRAKPLQRKLMILGSGRSGTDFSSRLFRAVGCELGHERTLEYGTSTHFFHTDHFWYPMLPWTPGAAHRGERLSDYEFEHVFHIVRDPLTCIPSIAKVFVTIDWEFAESTGLIPIQDMPKMERVMRYWLAINERIEERFDVGFRIFLEHYEEQWPEIQSILNIDEPWPNLKPSNRGTGYKKSEPTTYEALAEVNEPIAEAIWHMATNYGYE